MRSVALDLGVKETSFCKVSRGLVVARRTVGELKSLEDVLGRGSARARVAIEACREAWRIASTRSCSRGQSSRVGSPLRTCCRRHDESCAMSSASDERS
jgi:hypothetical protein